MHFTGSVSLTQLTGPDVIKVVEASDKNKAIHVGNLDLQAQAPQFRTVVLHWGGPDGFFAISDLLKKLVHESP